MTSAEYMAGEYMHTSIGDAAHALEFMEKLGAHPDIERLAELYQSELGARLGEVLAVMRRYFPSRRKSPNIPPIRQEEDVERGNSS